MFKQIITKYIQKCNDCAWYDNSSKRHNDSFTNAPYHMLEFCTIEDKDRLIHSGLTIDPKCPYPQEGIKEK